MEMFLWSFKGKAMKFSTYFLSILCLFALFGGSLEVYCAQTSPENLVQEVSISAVDVQDQGQQQEQLDEEATDLSPESTEVIEKKEPTKSWWTKFKKKTKKIVPLAAIPVIHHGYTTLSTLAHELGHAVTGKLLYGSRIRILVGANEPPPGTSPADTDFIAFVNGDPSAGLAFYDNNHESLASPAQQAITTAMGPITGLLFNFLAHKAWLSYTKNSKINPFLFGAVSVIMLWNYAGDALQFFPHISNDGSLLCKHLNLDPAIARGVITNIALLPILWMAYKTITHPALKLKQILDPLKALFASDDLLENNNEQQSEEQSSQENQADEINTEADSITA